MSKANSLYNLILAPPSDFSWQSNLMQNIAITLDTLGCSFWGLFVGSFMQYLIGIYVQTQMHTQSLSLCKVLKIVLEAQRPRSKAGNEHLLSRHNPFCPPQEVTNQLGGSSSLAWRGLPEPVLIPPYRNAHHQCNAATHTLSFVKQAQYF